MKFKIDKDVPLPAGNYRAARFPFDELELHDSFFVPTAEMSGVKIPLQSIRGSARSFCKSSPDKDFTVRRVKDGFRVWRTK